MFKQVSSIIVAVAAVCAGGYALAQVAGSVTLGVTVEEQKLIATGWSARNQVLGKTVYNDTGDSIGEVKDIIIAPDKSVSYAIVGVGGFIGVGQHDVLIPVGNFKFDSNHKLNLSGATKKALEG